MIYEIYGLDVAIGTYYSVSSYRNQLNLPRESMTSYFFVKLNIQPTLHISRSQSYYTD